MVNSGFGSNGRELRITLVLLRAAPSFPKALFVNNEHNVRSYLRTKLESKHGLALLFEQLLSHRILWRTYLTAAIYGGTYFAHQVGHENRKD
jgi:hypothetical protein